MTRRGRLRQNSAAAERGSASATDPTEMKVMIHFLSSCASALRTCRVRSRSPRLALVALLGLLVACGDDGVSPDPTVSFLVGDWEATRLEVAPVAAPEQSVDLRALGARFTLNVQPSGQYTASLSIPGLPPNPEIGEMDVEGNELVFRPSSPPGPTSRASYTQPDDDRVIFTGPSEFDLDGDGSADEVILEVEIVRN